MPVPCRLATGKTIAPAIKKPHDRVLMQTITCVSQEAMSQPTKITGNKSSMVSSLVFVFSLPVFEEVVEHFLPAFEVFLRPFFGDHEPGLAHGHKDICATRLREV